MSGDARTAIETAAAAERGRAGVPPDAAAQLRASRARLGLSQQQLAGLLGVAKLSVIRWEHGRSRPSLEHWLRVQELESRGAGSATDASTGSPMDAPRRVFHTPMSGSLTEFIGREQELAEVERLLGRSRLLTLTGPGGAGKTRLAIEVARRLTDAYPDGVVVVELAALADGGLVVQRVAAAIEVPEQPGRPLVESLVAALAPRRLLLVLDNCEHLADACAALADRLLRDCPHLTLLATSREPLAIAGEVVWQVPPLSLPEAARAGRMPHAPDVFDVATAFAADAVQLFVVRAQERQPNFRLTEASAAAVVRLCARLDGLPLAIEMAAARVAMLTPEEIAARLDDRFGLLTGPRRGTVPRHQTLQAAIDWSYALLDPAEQALFIRVGVFAGSFTLAAAEAVAGNRQSGIGSRPERSATAGDFQLRRAPAGGLPITPPSPTADSRLPIAVLNVLELLGRLVEKSLVVAEARDGVTRYRLLETLRAYAREQLRAADGAESVLERHAEYCLALAEGLAAQMWGADQAAGLAESAREYDNLLAALAWLVERDDGERAQRLAAALERFWALRGYFGEGRTWLARALACGGQERSTTRAETVRYAGSLARLQGDYATAEVLLGQAVALHEELENRQGMARALVELSTTRFEAGDLAGGEELGLQSLSLLRELDDGAGLLHALTMLGLHALTQHHYSVAEARFEEAIGLAVRLGRQDSLAMLHNNLGAAAYERRDYAAAREQFERCMKLAERLGDRRTTAYAHSNLGGVLARLGDLLEGERHVLMSLRISVELGFGFGITANLERLGIVAATGSPKRAARLFGRADSLLQELALPPFPYLRGERQEGEAAAQRALGEAAFAAAYTAGAAEPLERLLAELLAARSDEPVNSPTAAEPLETSASNRGTAYSQELTEREREVLTLMAQGHSTKEIARSLVLSPRTVERHLANLYPKIGARGRADAIAYALRQTPAVEP